MKHHTNNTSFWCIATMLTLLLTANASLWAQGNWNQSDACPGWNNPANFNYTSLELNNANVYSGQGGSVNSSKPCANVMSGETGVTWANTTYTPTQMSTVNCGSCSATSASNASLPNRERQFLIMTDVNGHDPNTDNHLPYIPTQFNNANDTTVPVAYRTNLTKSIRIGDACANGGNYGASALYYTMNVNTQNAMLYLYYAIVAEAPTHGMQGNPTFIIRVMRRNASNQWVQISDTLAYYITTTPQSNASTSPCPYMTAITPQPQGTQGWHTAQGTSVYYKDWEKVAINLSDYLYDEVQIQVMINDCEANYHYAYAYIAGECRPMILDDSGCPAGLSTNVTTLTAPRGVRSYAWYASEFGVANPIGTINSTNSYFTFRQLPNSSGTEADGAYRYNVTADDFRVTRRRNAAGLIETIDSIGNMQTFRCTMTSALDPAKEFTTHLYVNLNNTKPTMAIDSLSLCGGDVKLWNHSYVPGNENNSDLIDLASTSWKFYNNPACMGTPIDTLVGDSVSIHFNSGDIRYVRVRTNTNTVGTEECYSEKIYPIRPLMNPKAGMTISNRVLCDDGETTINDTSSGVVYRRWSFRQANAAEDDMTLGYVVEDENNEHQSITRSFTHSVEPIELYVRNGLYSVSRTDITDITWCADTAYDTVYVFSHPTLEVTGDTIVCQGGQTDATVNAVGVEGCTYQWSTSLGSITGGLPAGPTLRVTPTAPKTTFYVKVTSPQNCEAWDSLNVYLVTPSLTMRPADGRVCPGDTVTLLGENADHYTWSSSPIDPSLEGQDSLPTIKVTPQHSTIYTMVGHGPGNPGCDATPLTKSVTVLPMPIPHVSVEPNIIDTENPTVTLRNTSENSVGARWSFDDGSVDEGNEVTHTFNDAIGSDSVYVTLTPFNELNCKINYRFGIPVNLYTAWFPTIFTPGSEDENAGFRLYTINDYELFRIYIYNRRGELVFESQDLNFVWDGTCNGTPCPQGTYVYICRFRKPGMNTLSEQYGSVTLIR